MRSPVAVKKFPPMTGVVVYFFKWSARVAWPIHGSTFANGSRWFSGWKADR